MPPLWMWQRMKEAAYACGADGWRDERRERNHRERLIPLPCFITRFRPEIKAVMA